VLDGAAPDLGRLEVEHGQRGLRQLRGVTVGATGLLPTNSTPDHASASTSPHRPSSSQSCCCNNRSNPPIPQWDEFEVDKAPKRGIVCAQIIYAERK
jgi:hypothetical protein